MANGRDDVEPGITQQERSRNDCRRRQDLAAKPGRPRRVPKDAEQSDVEPCPKEVPMSGIVFPWEGQAEEDRPDDQRCGSHQENRRQELGTSRERQVEVVRPRATGHRLPDPGTMLVIVHRPRVAQYCVRSAGPLVTSGPGTGGGCAWSDSRHPTSTDRARRHSRAWTM